MSDDKKLSRSQTADSAIVIPDPPKASSVYNKLDQTRKETRLIVIEPGSAEEPLRCRMTTVSLLDSPAPPYETISYVWGDANLRSRASVNEQDLDIPLSAGVVLRRMRHEDQHRTVWIDAISINQEDIEDRNYQVSLMCDIYSKSLQCLIWLGEDDGTACESFQAMRLLYEEACRETDNFETFKATVWPGWWTTYGKPSSVQYNAVAMARMFDRPWFARLWVVQEAALSPAGICHCGPHTISMTYVQKASVWLYSKTKTSPSALTGHLGLARAVHIASFTDPVFDDPFRSRNNIQWMLHTLRQYDTSRDVDHIYGMVGMYQKFVLRDGSLPRRLHPNYEKPLKEVFCDIARLAIEEMQKLEPLQYVCHQSADDLDTMPSWVPSWHRKQDLEVHALPLNFAMFQASAQSKASPFPVEDMVVTTLPVRGFFLDSVAGVTETFTPEALKDYNQLLSLLDAVHTLSHGRPSPRGSVEQTLTAGHDPQRKVMDSEKMNNGYRAMMHHLKNSDSLPVTNQDQNTDDNARVGAMYFEAFCRWIRNRRFFTTMSGYVGIGPAIMRSKDEIMVLLGANVPMALRRRGPEDAFALVGHTHIDGVMLGEAAKAYKAAGGEYSRFNLV